MLPERGALFSERTSFPVFFFLSFLSPRSDRYAINIEREMGLREFFFLFLSGKEQLGSELFDFPRSDHSFGTLSSLLMTLLALVL